MDVVDTFNRIIERLTMGLADANDIVRESYKFWRDAGLTFEQTCAMLGNEEGETSFRQHVVGDKGQAYGIFQWHDVRADLIRDGRGKVKGLGVDVRTADHPDQLRAALFELQNFEKRSWTAIKAAKTIEETIEALVRLYERSSKQERDIDRRTLLAKKWAGIFLEDGL